MQLGKVDVKPPLKHWEEILEQWVSLNEELFKHAKGKFAAYSYRERTNISVMAGAAVRAGWIALEECWSEKEGSTLGVKNVELIFGCGGIFTTRELKPSSPPMGFQN